MLFLPLQKPFYISKLKDPPVLEICNKDGFVMNALDWGLGVLSLMYLFLSQASYVTKNIELDCDHRSFYFRTSISV